MIKFKIYLDTSVISNLIAPDAPDLMEYSLKLWNEIMCGLYDVFISDLVLSEVDACPEPKRSSLLEYIDKIEFSEVSMSDESLELAQRYVAAGIIPSKYDDDANHIAAATLADCSAIVSWNYKHMVKLKTIAGVNGINRSFGYRDIEIVTPRIVVGEED